jgi:hypothetical protein
MTRSRRGSLCFRRTTLSFATSCRTMLAHRLGASTRHPPQGAAEKSKWLGGNHCKFSNLRRASFRRFPASNLLLPESNLLIHLDFGRCSSLSPRNRDTDAAYEVGPRRRYADHTHLSKGRVLAAERSHLPGCRTRPRQVPAWKSAWRVGDHEWRRHGSDVRVRWRHSFGARSDRRAIGPGPPGREVQDGDVGGLPAGKIKSLVGD